MHTLEIKDLHVKIKAEPEHPEILTGVNLKLATGEIHAIMGPNGTGKSTLAETIMGNPAYEVTQGDVLIDGQSILDMAVDERARAGLFLGMQYPQEIAGVTNAEFIRAAINARRPEDDQIRITDFLKQLDDTMATLEMPESMADRYLNQGFSGGEKKRNEILQLMMIHPHFGLLDEIDSGLDIGSMIITHYQRLLDYIIPDVVHVMKGGRIIESGGPELAKELEKTGYEHLKVGDQNG